MRTLPSAWHGFGAGECVLSALNPHAVVPPNRHSRDASMKQKALAASAALVFAMISMNAGAQRGQFFAEGAVGRSNYSLYGVAHDSDKTDWASSIRAGYMWRGFVNYGFELGYADLGQVTNQYSFVHNFGGDQTRQSTAVAGWMLGGRL